MKQKYTITIADVQMNIVTDEPKESVESIVGILDRRIREIYLQSGNRCPKNEAALLCALDYCAERNKLQETVAQLEEEMKHNDIEEVRAEKAALAEELESVKAALSMAEDKLRAADAEAGLAAEQIRILTQKVIRADEATEIERAKVSELEEKLARAETAPVVEEEPEAAVEVAAEEEPEVEVEIVELPVDEVEEIAPAAEEPAPIAEVPTPVAEQPTAEPEVAEKTPVSELADELAAPFEVEMKPLRSNVDENQLTIEGAIAEKKDEGEKNLSDAKVMEKEKQKAQKRVRSMFDLITFDNV